MDTAAWLSDVEARADEKFARARYPRTLAILFDPSCALCRRCVQWMQHQSSYVPLSFVPCTGEQARARYGDIPWLGDELVVVSDAGDVASRQIRSCGMPRTCARTTMIGLRCVATTTGVPLPPARSRAVSTRLAMSR